MNGTWARLLAPTWRQRAKAVTLWLGANSSISFESGARVLRLDAKVTTSDVHVSVVGESSKARSANDVIVHRTKLLPDHHCILVDGVPATSAARTVVDLAGSRGGEELDAVAESARRLGLMSIAELERAVDQCGQARTASARAVPRRTRFEPGAGESARTTNGPPS